MPPSAIASFSYLVGGLLLTILAQLNRSRRTMHFELGVGVGLGVAGLIDLAAPLMSGWRY